ncbi:MAG: hypothetical protein ABIK83_04015 [Candidatus Zixiibacteriota bacterium]
MAQKGKKAAPAAPANKPSRQSYSLPFGKSNMMLFALGLLAVILGFVTLSLGSDTLAPILLVLGYCVIIPAAIIWKDKRKVAD